MKKRIFLYAIVFFVFYFLERQLSSFIDLPYKFVFRFIISWIFFFAFCLLKKPDRKELFLSFLFGLALPDIIIRLVENWGEYHYANVDLLLEVAGMLCAWHFFTRKKIYTSLIALCAITFLICRYEEYYMNYYKTGSFMGNVCKPINYAWQAQDKSGGVISSVINPNKIVVLDFWNTGCPVCFRKFPKLQSLYDKYKNDTSVAIYALNIPWRNDTAGIAFTMIEKKGYTFPVAVGSKGTDSLFSISGYPTVLIIRNDTILFRGSIEIAGEALQKLRK